MTSREIVGRIVASRAALRSGHVLPHAARKAEAEGGWRRLRQQGAEDESGGPGHGEVEHGDLPSDARGDRAARSPRGDGLAQDPHDTRREPEPEPAGGAGQSRGHRLTPPARSGRSR